MQSKRCKSRPCKQKKNSVVMAEDKSLDVNKQKDANTSIGNPDVISNATFVDIPTWSNVRESGGKE